VTGHGLDDAAALRRRIEAGERVADLRTRTAFAAGFVPGTFNFGLDGQFATYLGWLIPWGTPVTLLGESTKQVAEARHELVRIAIDRPAAAATGAPKAWVHCAAGYRATAAASILTARGARVVVVNDSYAEQAAPSGLPLITAPLEAGRQWHDPGQPPRGSHLTCHGNSRDPQQPRSMGSARDPIPLGHTDRTEKRNRCSPWPCPSVCSSG